MEIMDENKGTGQNSIPINLQSQELPCQRSEVQSIDMKDGALTLSGMKILLVDDTPTNIDVLIKTLEPEGYDLAIASGGEKALKIAKHFLPDLVLADVMMPDMNGFEMCRQLKMQDANQDVPVIFITARKEIEDMVEGFHSGGVDYITKPFQQEEVRARVRTHLQLRAFLKQQKKFNQQLQQEIRDRKRAEEALRKANQELRRLATLDGLTQVANRFQFDEYIRQEWRRLAREQGPLSLILCDVDYFKRYNDTYGHQKGDDCLRAIAKAITQSVRRPADLIARYGGEEFAVVLPNTKAEGAIQVAETIRAQVQQLAIPHDQSLVSRYVTLSLGVCSIIPPKDNEPMALTVEDLIACTDKALYEAKEKGRNCIILKTLEPGAVRSIRC
jgi:diguanylate cyclase (GGDEF)-like protein